jgi:hypothetical protein
MKSSESGHSGLERPISGLNCTEGEFLMLHSRNTTRKVSVSLIVVFSTGNDKIYGVTFIRLIYGN